MRPLDSATDTRWPDASRVYAYPTIGESILLPATFVKRLMELIRFRNEYDAFNGIFQVGESEDSLLQISWQKDNKQCHLTIDLEKNKATIQYRGDNGNLVEFIP